MHAAKSTQHGGEKNKTKTIGSFCRKSELRGVVGIQDMDFEGLLVVRLFLVNLSSPDQNTDEWIVFCYYLAGGEHILYVGLRC